MTKTETLRTRCPGPAAVYHMRGDYLAADVPVVREPRGRVPRIERRQVQAQAQDGEG